ncbi:MAG: tyrosine-type recombinase/integrase [Candidatus Marinimicrobia bacterium]|nr:tyrosine-type recombinase/integrase [Candidatus Neomarinimicrobiota bacterium]
MSKTWIITTEKYLNATEIAKLRKVIEKAKLYAKSRGRQRGVRDHAIIELALGTGLRVSEISELKVEDLTLKREASLIVRNGKGGKMREVRFSSRLKDIIKEHLDYRDSNSEYVFYTGHSDKMSVSALQQVFKKYAREAGLSEKYSIHACRHSYAVSLFAASGYNLKLLQRQMGQRVDNYEFCVPLGPE